MKKLYLFSRQIHRLLVVLITGLGAAMAGTGVMLKYPGPAVRLISGLDLGLVRFVHSTISTAFSLVLALMIMTGLIMYLVPWLQKRRSKAANSAAPLINNPE